VILGITVPGDIASLSASGKFLEVPLLVGNTAQESDIFIVETQLLQFGGSIPVVTQVVSDALTEVRQINFHYFIHLLTVVTLACFCLSSSDNCE